MYSHISCLPQKFLDEQQQQSVGTVASISQEAQASIKFQRNTFGQAQTPYGISARDATDITQLAPAVTNTTSTIFAVRAFTGSFADTIGAIPGSPGSRAREKGKEVEARARRTEERIEARTRETPEEREKREREDKEFQKNRHRIRGRGGTTYIEGHPWDIDLWQIDSVGVDWV
ncbi:hypothetical protein SNOG_13129 [Parastagonospora nodorum SN15]|uniref:Uncharacterized protein n=1 Tax=Phaeosphaeria nodorum (strain SN15 / ATCC MYA-4574 / FGSC 10173) TaxID=321614 RepID=Q0U535_PHANO|nr:hypothetical protein SNOG_13129 [Parastagonospora nodorum SN15]EAT79456.1 hypothetical protein SNOG_13129 [Parastagonospora nodorum SN15]